MVDLKLSPGNPYLLRAQKDLDVYKKGLWFELGDVLQLGEPIAGKVLREGLGYLSCQNFANTEIGNYIVASLPRAWVEKNIENAAESLLDLNGDEWEYRRLLELYGILRFQKAFAALLARGKASPEADIRECAADHEEILENF